MRRLLALVLLVPALAFGQTPSARKVYLDPQNPFSNDFAAGIQKKRVPVTLTTDADQSDFTVSLTADSNKGSKARGVTMAIMTGVYSDGAWDKVSMTVVNSKTKEMVFSYTCQKGGGRAQAVAECLAKHWKEQLEKK
jgi:hypothetical protein